jgi:hypothetical protein
MKPLWVIQKTAMGCSDFTGMVESIETLGLELKILNIPPFDYSSIPDVHYDGPIVPYGGTRFIDKIRQTKNWVCWFNDNFQYKLALRHFGPYMFNSDATCINYPVIFSHWVVDSAGFYLSDKTKIIRAISELAEKDHARFDKSETSAIV